jgi:hypothetical protein
VAADPLGTDVAGSAAAARRVERSALQFGRVLGAGSQGDIVEVSPPGVDGGTDALVAKLFHPHLPVDEASLAHLVDLRGELADDERRLLDAHAVWPSILIIERHRVVGYLMSEIPAPFWQMIATADGAEQIPREVQHLFVADDLAVRNLGETPSFAERLALARELAVALDLLDRHDLVFGDLSYRNEVYTLRPVPAVLLVDCDAVRSVDAAPAVAQLHSPGWKPPEGGPPTRASDRYKLGLFVLRCATPGVNAQNRDPSVARSVLDRPARRLLARSVGDDPADRPAAAAWVAELDRVLAGLGGVVGRTGPPVEPVAPPVLVPAGDPRAPERIVLTPPVRASAPTAPPAPTAPMPRPPGRAHRRPPWRKVPVKARRPRPHRVHPSALHGRLHPPAVPPAPRPYEPSLLSTVVWSQVRRRIVVVLLVIFVVMVAFTAIHFVSMGGRP